MHPLRRGREFGDSWSGFFLLVVRVLYKSIFLFLFFLKRRAEKGRGVNQMIPFFFFLLVI